MAIEQNQDRFSDMIKFRTSSIFEMMMWMQKLVQSYMSDEWKDGIISVLGTAYVDQLRKLYQKFHLGCDFTELAIEYREQHDISGFIQYVKELGLREFCFYLLGRVFPLESLPDEISTANLQKLIEANPELQVYCSGDYSLSWADDIEQIRRELIGLWKIFFEKIFRSEVTNCEPLWTESIQNREEYMNRYGGEELHEFLAGKRKLPPPMPPDTPYHEIVCIPCTRISRKKRIYFGYGNITILYDASRNEGQDIEVEEARKSALLMLKALGDENRLKILKLISDEAYTLNGKAIAAKLRLSPSVISRHLSQLRDAGVLEEQSEDNRNITYKLNTPRIDELSDLLILYLTD